MAKLGIVLADHISKDGTASVNIKVSHKTKTAYFHTGVSVKPSEFANGKVYGRKDARQLNGIIDDTLMQAKSALLKIESTIGTARLDVKELRDMLTPSYDPEIAEIKKRKKNSFINVFAQFKDSKTNKGTWSLYQRTEDTIRAYDKDIEGKSFEDIDANWLIEYKRFRSERENANTITTHFMHIKAVFNYAIYDLEITTTYPFRKKRNKIVMENVSANTIPMPVEHLRELWNAKLEPWQERWVDLAKLVFLFIGINMADLSELKEIDQQGYINYQRRKTRTRAKDGAHYHIKVEPEALEIINKWKGKDHLINIFDERVDYKTASVQMSYAVKCVGLPSDYKGLRTKMLVKSNSKYKYFCLYTLRKAWATIAFNECGISMEVISMALGHSDGRGRSVTQRYVYADNKLIDEANRKVIDWVLYNKK